MSGLHLILGAVLLLIPIGLIGIVVWAFLDGDVKTIGMTILALIALHFTLSDPENRR